MKAIFSFLLAALMASSQFAQSPASMDQTKEDSEVRSESRSVGIATE
jgi:hypothetical protein